MFQLHESTYLFISHQFMCNVVDMYHFVQLEIQEIISETVCPLLHIITYKRKRYKIKVRQCRIYFLYLLYFTAKLMLVHNVQPIPYGNKYFLYCDKSSPDQQKFFCISQGAASYSRLSNKRTCCLFAPEMFLHP